MKYFEPADNKNVSIEVETSNDVWLIYVVTKCSLWYSISDGLNV